MFPESIPMSNQAFDIHIYTYRHIFINDSVILAKYDRRKPLVHAPASDTSEHKRAVVLQPELRPVICEFVVAPVPLPD